MSQRRVIEVLHEIPQATGLRRMGLDRANGIFFVWAPRRIKTYTCPEAGVEHDLYWRGHGNAGDPARDIFACEHSAEVIDPR